MTQNKRRLFTGEQKVEALCITGQPDKPISQVAKELGIGVNTIHGSPSPRADSS